VPVRAIVIEGPAGGTCGGHPRPQARADPCWFALHKLWMSEKATRNRQNQPKDLKQEMLLLAAIAESMPHYPLDGAFVAELPGELLPHFEKGRAGLKS
jgi:hypothetical protein